MFRSRKFVQWKPKIKNLSNENQKLIEYLNDKKEELKAANLKLNEENEKLLAKIDKLRKKNFKFIDENNEEE